MTAIGLGGIRRFSLRRLLLGPIEAVWANPVVVRDLRAQMRGARTYWQLSLFLLMLGLLSIAGYMQATSGNTNIVAIQARLQSLYYFIFVTLAALTALIAPALTASSITGERQRQTLDLLVTTPMSAAQLLTGKLISSTAFLLLLLALSLPASALCVMLGGATIGDVFGAYLLLAIDGLLLAAIGLYFSCAARSSFLALIWTYATLLPILGMTGSGAASLLLSPSGSRPHELDALAAIMALNPFAAVLAAPRTLLVAGHEIPIWVGTALAAFLIIRLLVTASAVRLAFYGDDYIGSLRRQVLLLTAVPMLAISYTVFGAAPMTSSRDLLGATFYMLLVPFLVATTMLPSLFVPAVADDAPAGTIVRDRYRVRAAFRAEHGGALPYFHLWLLTLSAAYLTGMIVAGKWRVEAIGYLFTTLFYLSALGFLYWSLSRRAATLVRGVSGGRALSFGIFALLVALPMMAFGLIEGAWTDNPLSWFWLLAPMLSPTSNEEDLIFRMLFTGGWTYGLGLLLYPFWRSVEPGALPNRRAAE